MLLCDSAATPVIRLTSSITLLRHTKLHHAFIDKTWIDFLRERGSTYHDSNVDLPGFENLPDAGCVEYLAPRAGIRPESAKTGVHSNGTTGPARLPRTPFFELGQMQMPVVMFQRQLDGIQELCG